MAGRALARDLAGRALARALAGLAARDAARFAGLRGARSWRATSRASRSVTRRASPGLGTRLGRLGRARARGPVARRGAALRGGHLLGHDGLGQRRDQLRQEGGHALLLAAELARELGRVAIAQRLGERLDREVVADLLLLVHELRLGVLEQLLGLARAAQRVHRRLRRRSCLARGDGRLAGRPGHDVRAGQVRGLGLAAELLDPPLERLRLGLGLLQVVLQALPVGRATTGHLGVGLERSLELLLLAVRLVEVLDQLCVAFGQVIRHGQFSSSGFRLGLSRVSAPADS